MVVDLCTGNEHRFENSVRLGNEFNYGLKALDLETNWMKGEFDFVSVDYFGASTGAGAALMAAAQFGNDVDAVVPFKP